MFTRFDLIASIVVNTNHGTIRSAVMAGVSDRIAGSVWSVIPQPTERQRIGNQIDAAFVFAWPDFVNGQWAAFARLECMDRKLHNRDLLLSP